jgi:hypothetical protein
VEEGGVLQQGPHFFAVSGVEALVVGLEVVFAWGPRPWTPLRALHFPIGKPNG